MRDHGKQNRAGGVRRPMTALNRWTRIDSFS
jgi:hypothetical protein